MATKKITVDGINFYKSKYTTNYSPVYISDNMSAKMEFIPAISTSCLLNPYCQARAKNPESICAQCYADGVINRYSALSAHLTENTSVLAGIIPEALLPRFKDSVEIVRFEAFGDLFSTAQMINYINIARVNPHVTFTLWTKNKGLARRGIEEMYKPDNLILVYSANKINTPESLPQYFDKVFTVWTSEEAARAAGFEINCGARKCNACRTCYNLENMITAVNELVKKIGGKKK